MVLLAACLTPTVPARSQSGSPSAGFVNLDSKAASKLLVKNEPPKYPPEARVNYIQGRVRVQILVSGGGRIGEAHVLLGHPFLAASALRAIRQWVYRPYRIGLRAVEFTTIVDINFALRSKKLVEIPPSAEKDLQAQVIPPEVLDRHEVSPSRSHVRLRVLVDSEGHAIDAQAVSGRASEIEEAQRKVVHWTFRPARWGTLAVPWYLVVDVPVRPWPAETSAGDPGGR